jgi:predicted site-specific integrase-resolvase
MNGAPQKRYVRLSEAKKYFGVSQNTMYDWEREGIIKVIKTSNKDKAHRRYDMESFCGAKEEEKQVPSKPQGRGVCYCRVSTPKQYDDLERQIKFTTAQYPTYDVIKDVGSGINFKRKGLLKLLKGAVEGTYSTVVVSSKDRLARFGIELLQWLFEYYKVTFLVLDSDVGTEEQELTKDLLTIIHVFACKANGKRRYTVNKGKREEEQEIKEETCTKGTEEERTVSICGDKED